MSNKKTSKSKKSGIDSKSSETSKSSKPQKSSLKGLFRGKIKFAIYSYLEIYRKLTSNQICELVNRSKPTVHDHLKDLISMGVIAEPHYRDKDGNFIYEFSPDYEEKLNLLDAEFDYSEGLSIKLLASLAEGGINMLNTFQSLLKKEISFFKNLIDNINDKQVQYYRKLAKEIMKFEYDEKGKIKIDDNGIPSNKSILSNTFFFFDEETFQEFRKDFHKLTQKYDEKLIQQTILNKNQPIERPICFIAHSMPIKVILEENLKEKENENS